MARAIWSGALSFGLVNVPVKVFTAVRDDSIHFHQLDAKSGSRIQYQKVSAKTGKEVDAGDIEKGYELPGGDYVVVDTDELADLRPRATRTVDITDFVALDDIDPIYYDHTYWLAPDGEAAERPYKLLLAAMEDKQRVGIGTVVMRTKQYLAAIRPLDGALAMSTMRFADEVVPKADVDGLPSRRGKADAKELKLAGQIVDSLAAEWDPARYHDTYTEELEDLIARKAKGETIEVEEAEEPSAEVIDLMSALEASVADAKSARSSRSSSRSRGSSSSRSSSATKRSSSSRSSTKASHKKAASRSKRAS